MLEVFFVVVCLFFVFWLMLFFSHQGEWEQTSKCLSPGGKAGHPGNKERLYKFIKSLAAALMGSTKQKKTTEENKRAKGPMEASVLVGF